MNTTTPKLLSAEHLGGYRIRLRFADDACGIVDLEGELWGECSNRSNHSRVSANSAWMPR